MPDLQEGDIDVHVENNTLTICGERKFEKDVSHLAITQDLTRVMNRLKALYRSWAIPCAGERVYAPRHRSEWLAKITEAGIRRRAEVCYQQLDTLQALRRRSDGICWWRARPQLDEFAAPDSFDWSIRAALLIALIQTPHRFRTKRQLSGIFHFRQSHHSSRRKTLRASQAVAYRRCGRVKHKALR